MIIAKKWAWRELENSVFALLFFTILLVATSVGVSSQAVHPFQGVGFLSLVFFFAVQYRFLFKQEKDYLSPSAGILQSSQVLSAWLLFAIIFWEAWWQKHHLEWSGTAAIMIWFVAIVVPTVILVGAVERKSWPFSSFESEYKNWIPAPLLLLALFWFLSVCNKTIGQSEHYLPVLNPFDLGQFAMLLILAYSAKKSFLSSWVFLTKNLWAGLLGGMFFLWLNVVMLRALSHYQSIAYDLDSLWHTSQVQMAISILWTLCALAVMNLSRRLLRRELWIIGAGLLALVVIKLAVKDLSSSGTLATIVSFLVVGGLMLLIGFLSPIPPKRVNAAEANTPSPRDAIATFDENSTKEVE